jgi:hypothetical protein
MKLPAHALFAILALVVVGRAGAQDLQLSLFEAGIGGAAAGQVKKSPDYLTGLGLGDATFRFNDSFAVSAGVLKGTWLLWTDSSEVNPLPNENYGFLSVLPMGVEYDFLYPENNFNKTALGLYAEHSWVASREPLERWTHAFEVSLRLTAFHPPELWQVGDLCLQLGYSNTAGAFVSVNMKFLTLSSSRPRPTPEPVPMPDPDLHEP